MDLSTTRGAVRARIQVACRSICNAGAFSHIHKIDIRAAGGAGSGTVRARVQVARRHSRIAGAFGRGRESDIGTAGGAVSGTVCASIQVAHGSVTGSDIHSNCRENTGAAVTRFASCSRGMNALVAGPHVVQTLLRCSSVCNTLTRD